MIYSQKQKRGQAAMEFLMTYGWAILAAIIAIGVLAYFGVFSPGRLAGSSAVVNNPFYAEAWSATPGTAATASMKLEVINNGGDAINVTYWSVNGTGNSAGVNCQNTTITTANLGQINPGQKRLIESSGCALSSGTAYAGDIRIIYHKVGSSLSQTATGTIRIAVQ